jgi:hypothetical protein
MQSYSCASTLLHQSFPLRTDFGTSEEDIVRRWRDHHLGLAARRVDERHNAEITPE